MPRRDVTIYGLTFLLSLFGHVGLIRGLGEAARRAPRRTYRPVEFALLRPEPPKEIPKPPPPKSIDLTKVKPKDLELPPPPNTSEPPPKDAAPPRPVFGISMSSTVGPGSGAGFTVRVGNTLMQEPDKDFTAPADVRPYSRPPVPLSQVTKMPKAPAGGCPREPYPAEAKSQRIEGEVTLEVEVLADGTVGDVRLLKGLGHGLDDLAIRGARACKFEPAELQGQAVVTRIRVPYIFVIED